MSLLGGEGYFLIVVIYFAVTNAGYDGSAEFFQRNVIPSDIDDPRGLQDTLASATPAWACGRSPRRTSRRARPIPNVLVAASKFYNRDPDSLPEYDFKIGTYASFDRGRTLGRPRPAQHVPAGAGAAGPWPLGNTCYPADDPTRGGNEPEDEDDPTGNGDFGEDYITSDPWVDFDDEGNAYAMVLDSPTFTNGNGWGMSFHRWKSVVAQDVQRGRHVEQPDHHQRLRDAGGAGAFLDDKNTFAVNNAGRDRDGKTGIIVACWGQNYDLTNIAARQADRVRALDRRWAHVAGRAEADLGAGAAPVRPVRDRRPRRRRHA